MQPDGVVRPPHDYGLAIVLLGAADRVVPANQAEALRAAILSYLEASRLDMVDKAKANVEFARAKTLAAALDEPSRTYMNYVNARDVTHLGPLLLPHVSALGGDPALSPARSAAPEAAGLPPPRHGGQRRPRRSSRRCWRRTCARDTCRCTCC